MPRSNAHVLLSIALALSAFACRKPPAELAPAGAGDFFDYKFSVGGGGGGDSVYLAKITLSEGKSEDSLTLGATPSGGEDPVLVDRALDPGKKIKIHFIGQLWLPPAERVVGTKTRAGQVKEQTTWSRWDVFVVEDLSGRAGHYYFDSNTGFLVGYQIPTGAGTQSAILTGSSIAGL